MPRGEDRPDLAEPSTEAERRVLPAAAHLARVRDLPGPPEVAYRRALPRARWITMERLVRGLLRGRPSGLPEPLVVPRGSYDPGELPRGAPAPDPAALRAAVPGEAEAVGLLPLPGIGRLVVAPVARRRGFARHDLARPVLRAGPDDIEAAWHPTAVVEDVAGAGGFVDAGQARRIQAEVAEGVANLALALVAEEAQARTGPGDPVAADPADLPAADRLAYLERIVTRGHPYHPAAKIRRGMAPTANLAYGPEFAGRIPLRFAAVRGDRVKRVRARKDGPTLTRRMVETFDGLAEAAAEALPAVGLEDHALLPVHPWQYHHVLPDRYRDEVDDGLVVPVEGFTHPATPLLNTRTVVPHPGEGVGPHPPHCKLALGVQLTNVERTLSPQAVHNGPRVTRLLRDLLGGPALGSVGVLGEPAAAGLHPPGGPHTEGEAFDHARHLGGLVRRNPRLHPLAPEDGLLVPASSLVAEEPGGDPILAGVLDRYRAAAGADTSRAAARGFLEELAAAAVPGNLRLLTLYGVALEAHLQNAVLALEGGRPSALLVRDLGGIRLHGGRLAEHGQAVDIYPDSDVEADGARDLHRKLFYTLFQNLLAEVVVALDRLTPADEGDLWSVVGRQARATFERLRADPSVPDGRVDADEAALLADPCEHKAITAMRLRGKRHEYVTSMVPNPLEGPQRRPGGGGPEASG